MILELNRLVFNFDFPGGSDSKASVYNAGDLGSIPGSGRFEIQEIFFSNHLDI